jgi:hypothetical protein
MIRQVLDFPHIEFQRTAEPHLPPTTLLKFRHRVWGRMPRDQRTIDLKTTNPIQRKYEDQAAYISLSEARLQKLLNPANKIDRGEFGIFEFVTDWDIVRVDKANLQTSRLINALNESDRLHGNINRACDEAQESANTHLWALRSRESYCPLTLLGMQENELTELAGTYVYSRSAVWSCDVPLSEQNWKTLIDQELGVTQPEEGTTAEIARLDRQISVEVRREVWRRDQGRCTTCGSQDRLEFDHIIPVAIGGSNTVRNVQLLCECCNREKGATLG